ncbi:MAG: amino acid ABC transporter ATP-binding protein [Desulfobacter sp.]|nr:amino acid ABC transporter ATP-binding protein [Desulfobacter sp.]WDP84397.1 MAG: amino acid ABC transporter ATP-binding protein [Desulfobacter sp.]
MNHSDYAICVENLHKRFGSIKVLKGINFSARKGEVISILGSSGSGKSTLLRSINLLETPEQGNVYIDGEMIRMQGKEESRKAADNSQINRIRSKLGMVFQNFNLWTHMTIIQNVMEGQIQVLGRSKAMAREIAEKYLKKVGVGEKADAYPSQLSGGQQQRVAIARALAHEGRTMLIVTHEMKFARDVSSRIVFLDEGEITEDGPPEEVFTHPKTDRFRQFVTMNPGH